MLPPCLAAVAEILSGQHHFWWRGIRELNVTHQDSPSAKFEREGGSSSCLLASRKIRAETYIPAVILTATHRYIHNSTDNTIASAENVGSCLSAGFYG